MFHRAGGGLGEFVGGGLGAGGNHIRQFAVGEVEGCAVLGRIARREAVLYKVEVGAAPEGFAVIVGAGAAGEQAESVG